jgi:hypothetical protein
MVERLASVAGGAATADTISGMDLGVNQGTPLVRLPAVRLTVIGASVWAKSLSIE